MELNSSSDLQKKQKKKIPDKNNFSDCNHLKRTSRNSYLSKKRATEAPSIVKVAKHLYKL